MRINILLKKIVFVIITVLILASCSDNENEKNPTGNLTDVSLEPGDIYAVINFMDYGEVTFKLFPDIAPIGVEKFVSLAERGFYERKTIHRVVKNALIQGGSLNGDGSDGNIERFAFFDIESSEYAKNFNGALCFAPDKNGQNFSQFYIISNKEPVDIDIDIEKLEEQLNDKTILLEDDVRARYQEHLNYLKSISDETKDRYRDKGGYYPLDDKNTVFGQIVTGYEVIEAIANVEVASGNYLDDEAGFFSKPAETIIIESVKIIRIPLPEPTTTPEETKATRASKPQRTTPTHTTRPEDAFTDLVVIGETSPPYELESDGDEPSESSEPDETLISDSAQVMSSTEITEESTVSETSTNEITTIFDIDSGQTMPEPTIE